MRKYLKFKKAITFFAVLTFLFIGVRVSTAQIQGLSSDTVLPDDSTLSVEELGTIEESIKKTEDILDTIDQEVETRIEGVESSDTVTNP